MTRQIMNFEIRSRDASPSHTSDKRKRTIKIGSNLSFDSIETSNNADILYITVVENHQKCLICQKQYFNFCRANFCNVLIFVIFSKELFMFQLKHFFKVFCFN